MRLKIVISLLVKMLTEVGYGNAPLSIVHRRVIPHAIILKNFTLLHVSPEKSKIKFGLRGTNVGQSTRIMAEIMLYIGVL